MRKPLQPILYLSSRLEPHICNQFIHIHIRIRHRHIPRLHRQMIFHRLLTQCRFQRRNKPPQRHRLIIPNIINLIRCLHRRRRIHLRLRNTVNDPHHTLDNIVDISEIPQHIPVVIHINRLTRQNCLSELEIRHIRSAPCPIHRKKAQTRRRYIEQMAVNMRHQLIRFLGSSIQTDRIIHPVSGTERLLHIHPIHRTRRRIHQMLHPTVAATFQHIHKAHHIGIDISIRVINRIPHPPPVPPDSPPHQTHDPRTTAPYPPDPPYPSE